MKIKYLFSILTLFLFIYPQNVIALPGCSYSSNFFDNCYGMRDYDNGDQYIGDFQNDKKHGNGLYSFANGDQYIGEVFGSIMYM